MYSTQIARNGSILVCGQSHLTGQPSLSLLVFAVVQSGPSASEWCVELFRCSHSDRIEQTINKISNRNAVGLSVKIGNDSMTQYCDGQCLDIAN